MRCPICGTDLALDLIERETRDDEAEARRKAWAEIEDDALRREAEGKA